jgi:hypothetical protein
MNLSFLKVENYRDGVITFLEGCIQLVDGFKTFSIDEPITLELDEYGRFKDVLRDVKFVVYEYDEIFPSYSKNICFFNVLALQSVTEQIYKEVDMFYERN